MNIIKKEFLFFSISILLVASVYITTRTNPSTPYTYFVQLAKQLIMGKVHLDSNISWLNELVPGSGNRWFVVYPPMPAIVCIPFILFNFGDQTIISIIFAILNFILLYMVTRRLYQRKIGLFQSLAFVLGTNHWYLATEGSAWYFSHIIAIFFLLIAFLCLNIKQNKNSLIATYKTIYWLLGGLSLGAAYWSRLPTILALPFFIYLAVITSKYNYAKILQKIGLFLAGCGFFICLNFTYNYIRFGTIWDVAYNLIPGVLEEPWYSQGIFSLSYLPRNIQFLIAKMPLGYEKIPFVKPSVEGMALWLTSPFFLLLPFVNWKKKWTFVLLLSGALMIIPGLLHGTVGFSQFGYRFGLEGSLLWLIAMGTVLERRLVNIVFYLLILGAILTNFWGIYFIRFLDVWGW